MIGKENVNLNTKQIEEIVDLIDKEEYLENEEKVEKALAKSKEQRDQLKQQKEPAAISIDETLITKSDDSKHILSEDQPSDKEKDTKSSARSGQ